MRTDNPMIIPKIELPKPQSKDGLFLAFLLKGHILWQDNWTALTGFHNHAQRAYHLRQNGIPVKDVEYTLPPLYPRPLAFYSLDREIYSLIEKDALNRFIEAVEQFFSQNEIIKKGLQETPQPLKSILAGKL